jgi:hypothetical protein
LAKVIDRLVNILHYEAGASCELQRYGIRLATTDERCEYVLRGSSVSQLQLRLGQQLAGAHVTRICGERRGQIHLGLRRATFLQVHRTQHQSRWLVIRYDSQHFLKIP